MRLIKLIIILMTIFVSTVTFAALDLELTQGSESATPIAIVPFAGQSNDLGNAAPNNIAAVVTNDLSHSGQFKALPVSDMPQTPNDASSVDFDAWKRKNINDVVVGKVTALGGDQYRIIFQLMDVFNHQTSATLSSSSSRQAWQSAVLLQKNFTVPASQLRNLAHHISDMIYEKLTGVRGIFSTKIAYVLVKMVNDKREYYLEVSDADGYFPKALLTSNEPIMSPSWSSDARKLAYVSFEGGFPAIYIQDVATGGRQRVSNIAGINGAPRWSPDGSKLALVLTKTGYPKIYILNLATHQFTQVTDGWSIDTEPAWFPDGNSLIFTSNRGGGPQIYQINLATKEIHRVTYDGDYNATASFTPDGQDIVLLHRENGFYNIAIEDLSTGRLNLLTQSEQDQSPSVAPNGKMVVYATRYGGQGVLGMVSTDGLIKLLLPSRDGIVREPAWSPFRG